MAVTITVNFSSKSLQWKPRSLERGGNSALFLKKYRGYVKILMALVGEFYTVARRCPLSPLEPEIESQKAKAPMKKTFEYRAYPTFKRGVLINQLIEIQ